MDEEAKKKLRALRDRIAALGAKVRLRPDANLELSRRIVAATNQVENALRLIVTNAAKPVANLEETIEDTVAEAHLLTHELERLLATPAKAIPRAGGAERRQHERHETDVTVRLLRHVLQVRDIDGGVALSTETANRPARNVSTGGIFVALPAGELPQVGVGNVLHVRVETQGLRFEARAHVARRDANGVGLSWMLEDEGAKRAVQSLLEIVRSRVGRGLLV